MKFFYFIIVALVAKSSSTSHQDGSSPSRTTLRSTQGRYHDGGSKKLWKRTDGPYFNFFNEKGNFVGIQMLDPLFNPGVQSEHLHVFDGGSNLAATIPDGALVNSNCTTNRLRVDKSLYWRPALYWKANETGYHLVPVKASHIYYLYGDPDNQYFSNVSEFPMDFEMVAGNTHSRSPHNDTVLREMSLQWHCLDSSGKET